MIHANGHIICSIDTETTGTNYRLHEMWQIGVVPLTYDLEPDTKINPFICEMAPSKFDDIDWTYINQRKMYDLADNAMNKNTALDLFVEWIERLHLGTGKRIMPLAHNWCFDKQFLEEWMGPQSYNYYIDSRYRDLMAVANFINDTDDAHATPYHFPKQQLGYICNCLGIEFDTTMAHDAHYDAVKTAEAYKKCMQTTRCLQ